MISSSLKSSVPRTLIRSYATSTSSAVRPPLQLNGLPGKYASSAYVAALSKDSKTLEKLEKDLDQVSQALDSKNKDSAKLKAFIENPTLSVKERTSGLDGLFSGKPDPITRCVSDTEREKKGNGKGLTREKGMIGLETQLIHIDQSYKVS